MNNNKFLCRMIILLILAISPLVGRAACTAENGWNNKLVTLNFPAQITVQADAPTGGVFYETTMDFGNNDQFASCSGTYTSGTKYSNGWTADGSGIAATNVPGVGVRIYFSDNSLVPTNPIATYNNATLGFYWGLSYSNRWHIQLIKTGEISGGTLQPGSYASFGIGGILITTLNIGGGGAVTPTGCTLTTPDVTVSLEEHRKSEFAGVGYTTAWQEFNIGLQCNKSARINVQIDATQDASNIPGVMKLDDGGSETTASGVGVELWYRPDNSAVQFGKPKFYYTSPSGGSETVQLKARYHQTAETVTAGLANATATFTLTYQ